MVSLNMKTTLRRGLMGLAAATLTSAGALAADLQELGFATSASGGTGYMYAVAVATVVNEGSDAIKITPFPSAGVVENDRLLRNDEAQLILHTGGQAFSSFRGEGKYPGPFEDLRAIMPIYASLVQMIVLAGSDIQTPGDLAGKRVGLGEPGSSANTYVRQVLKAESVNDGDYDGRPNNLIEQVAGMRDGNLDALTTVMGGGAPALQDLATSRDVRWLSVTPDTLKSVIGMNPTGAVVPVTIPAGTYPQQDGAVQTFGVPIWIMAKAEMPDALVSEIVTKFLSNLPRAHEVHPVVEGTTKDFVANASPPVPWHPEAVKALAAMGYETTPFTE